MDDSAILDELIALAQRGEFKRARFRSRAGAHQYLRLYPLFRRYVPPGAEVLDWGAGSGHFSYFLCRAGYRASGYSFHPYEFASWLADPAYRFSRGDPAEPVKLPFADASFDAVASIGVLEHVRETGGNEAGSLAEIVRVLRPGGVFVCYHLPNRNSWIELGNRWLRRPHAHPYRFRRADIERLARGAGLEILQLERYGFLPRNSLERLPAGLPGSRGFARGYDRLDDLLGRLFGPICQNWCFVARRA